MDKSSSSSRLQHSTTASQSDEVGQRIEIPIADALELHKTRNTKDTNKRVVFLDGSWWLPNAPKTARQQYEEGPRIVDAQFVDIDDICDFNNNPKNLPHMLPSPTLFAKAMDAMDITNDDFIILYGQPNCPYVYRAWFLFLSMGHGLEQTWLLEGSIDDWKNAGGPIDDAPTTVTLKAKEMPQSSSATSTRYQCTVAKPQFVVNLDEMKDITTSDSSSSPLKTLIVDARSEERFLAQVDEPRPGLKRGHMPGAVNLPFVNVVDPTNMAKLKSYKELTENVFPTVDVEAAQTAKRRKTTASSTTPSSSASSSEWWKDESCRIVTTCGSGATACTLVAALVKCGRDPSTVAIYDGSWAEWGAEPNVPIVNATEEEKEQQ